MVRKSNRKSIRKLNQTKRRKYGGNICSITREQTGELFKQIIARIPESEIDAETKKAILNNEYLSSNFFRIINEFCEKNKITTDSTITTEQKKNLKKTILSNLGKGVKLNTNEVETIFKLIKENSKSISQRPPRHPQSKSRRDIHPSPPRKSNCPSLDSTQIIFSKVDDISTLSDKSAVFILNN